MFPLLGKILEIMQNLHKIPLVMYNCQNLHVLDSRNELWPVGGGTHVVVVVSGGHVHGGCGGKQQRIDDWM